MRTNGQPSGQLFPKRWPLSNSNRTKRIMNKHKVKHHRNSDTITGNSDHIRNHMLEISDLNLTRKRIKQLCSDNKSADHLYSFRASDQRLCLSICRNQVFSRRGTVCEVMVERSFGDGGIVKHHENRSV